MSVLFPENVTIIQRTGSYGATGIWSETQSQITITGDVQPMTDLEIESLNIGQRQLGKVKLYSNELLNISDGTANGDIVLFNGEYYELINQQIRTKLISHYKYIGELRKDFTIVEGD